MAYNPTPKSKIAQLRRDIEQLDQKMTECTTDRPYQPRSGPQDLKTERPTAHQAPVFQSTAIRERLAALQRQKDTDLLEIYARKEALETRVSETKASLPHLAAQITEARRRFEGEKTKVEVQHRMQTAKRKKELQTTEKDAEQLFLRKQQLEFALQQAQEDANSSEERVHMAQEELLAWARLHEELVGELEEAETRVDHLTKQRDIPALVAGIWTQRGQHRSERQRDSLQTQLAATGAQLAVLSQASTALSAEKLALQTWLNEESRHGTELGAMEDRLEAQLGLNTAVSEGNQAAGFDIDEEILRIQVSLVEKRLQTIEKKHVLDTLDVYERELEGACPELQQASAVLRRSHLNRAAAVAQWRSAAEELLRGKTLALCPAADSAILQEIRRKSRHLRADKRLAADRLLEEYWDSLKNRESALQSAASLQKRDKLTAVASELEQNQETRVELQAKLVEIRTALKEITAKERKEQATEPDTSHPDFQLAEALVARVIYWEELAATAANRVKSLGTACKEAVRQTESLQQGLLQKQQDLASLHLQLRKAEAKAQALAQGLKTPPPVPPDTDLVQTQAALTQANAQIAAWESSLRELEAEQGRIEAFAQHEQTQLQMQHQAYLHSDARLGLMTPQIDPTESADLGFATLSKGRSSSELHGTARSRSLLRTSVPRLPSRSPIEDHSPMLELLDLDDDLGQLLETLEDVSPIKRPIADLTLSDKDFYQRILPLLEGGELYKKYSKSNSLKQRAFDPLLVSELPPEACGYGIRTFKLARPLTEVEVLQGLKSLPESSLSLEHIHGPLIPQATMTILKTQKRLMRTPGGKGRSEETVRKYKEMKESGFVNVNSAAYEEMCRGCDFYPFSIVLTHSGRVELVARTYYTFKTWVNGLNALLKRKSDLPDLSVRLKTTRRWV